MATNIGYKFAILVQAPADWNATGLLPEAQVAVRSSQGEGLLIEIQSRVLREKLLQGAELWVYLAHILREDAEILYGFGSPGERALFLELRDIDSIGPKTAAQILAALDNDRLGDLIHGRSLAGMKIPGVGPKTLEKLSSGIKSKREKFLSIMNSIGWKSASGAGIGAGAVSHRNDKVGEVPFALIQGLEKLGLRREDVLRIYRDLEENGTAVSTLPASEQIRLVLQRWGQYRSKIQMSSMEGHS